MTSVTGYAATPSDTAANWATTTKPIDAGLLVFEKDTGHFKIGDGSSLYSALSVIINAQASQTSPGLIQIATASEVNQGTNNTKAVTPSTLASLLGNENYTTLNAVETWVGSQNFATQAYVGSTAIAAPTSNLQVGDRLRYNGSTWVNGRNPLIASAFIPSTFTQASPLSTPLDGQALFFHSFAVPTTFAANFAAATSSGAICACKALVKATALTTLKVYKCLVTNDPSVNGNWVLVGTIAIGANAYAGTMTTVSGAAVTYAAGDMMLITSPATPDQTLGFAAITLSGDQ